MKEFELSGYCYGKNHQKCYFMREISGNKFCGLWMRNIIGVVNNKRNAFKCKFCNASSVIIKSNAGAAFIENPLETDSGGRSISNL